MKKTLLFLLVLAMLVCSLVSCGKKDEEKILGKWEAKIDFTDEFNNMLGEDDDISEYLKIDDFSLVAVFDFKDDGKVSMSVDKEALKNMIDEFKDDFKTGIKKYFEAMAKEQGLDLTVDEIFEQQGTTLDEFADTILNADTLIESAGLSDAETDYEFKDGALIIEEDSFKYEFKSDSELVLNIDEADIDEDMKTMFPMTLKKK